jgi:hypothetical protein
MQCPRHPDSVVRHLPPTPDLPVLLAARLSLSFPGLISAVPLYYIDFARAPDHVRLVTAWFSDGGIASNFPMHLFDAMLPLRPTFGFDLQPQTAEHGADRVLIPARLSVRGHEIAGLAGFVSSILDTMQNWSDTTQLAMRTFSARVPEIRLDTDEGGINLAMPPDLIEELARRGGEAAALLDGFDFGTHQDRRAQMSLRALDELGEQMRVARVEGFDVVLDRLTPQQRRQAATSLLDLWGEWAATHPLSTGPSPRLQADLRLSPRL